MLAKLIATLKASIAPAAIRSAAMSAVAPRERTSIMRQSPESAYPGRSAASCFRHPEVRSAASLEGRRPERLGRHPSRAASRPPQDDAEKVSAPHRVREMSED